MAWDDSLPNNQTKIRNYPTVLTANFSAIEQGGSTLKQWKANFYERDQIGMGEPATPVRIDDVMQLYSRANDYSGETDFFILDDRSSANEIALTEDGSLGGQGQSILCSNITFGDSTFSNTLNNMIWAYGTIPAGGGAITGGVNLGTATTGTVGSDSNAYTIPLSVTTDNANYIVLATPMSSRGNGQNNNRTVNIIPGTKTTSQFSLRMQLHGTDTNRKDVPIQIAVMGGWS